MLEIKTVKILERAGWHKDRRIDISENVAFLESRGFEVFETAEKFMQEFGELKINVEEKMINNTIRVSRHNTCIKDVIGISDSSWYRLEGYTEEKVIPVGRVYNGKFVLYIGESGKMYLSFGWAGDTPMEAFKNIICNNGIIIWDKYCK